MLNENTEKELERLIKQLEIQNSVSRNFFISVIRGFGSALGATFVFGLALAILYQLIRSIDYVPILNKILNSQAIEELIKRFTSTT